MFIKNHLFLLVFQLPFFIKIYLLLHNIDSNILQKNFIKNKKLHKLLQNLIIMKQGFMTQFLDSNTHKYFL